MMSEAPERIWGEVFRRDEGGHTLTIAGDYPLHREDSVEYIRADLTRPKVKPLEWVEGDYTTRDDAPMEERRIKLWDWRADIYTIIRQRGPDGLYVLRDKSDGIGAVVPTLEDAKAAAQEDYERRILAALEMPE